MNRTDQGRNGPLLSVVAPFYNEHRTVDIFVGEVIDRLEGLRLVQDSELVLVNDGSSDGTGLDLDRLAGQNPGLIRVVHFSRNFGHAAAVLAGLEHSRGRAVIVMDSDLQDDPAAFEAFIGLWREGFDVVLAQRTTRRENPVLKLLFWSFYRLLNAVSPVKIPRDAGNYSLMDRRVVDNIILLGEQNSYLPGMRAWVGFKQAAVPVPRRERRDGKVKVGLKGKWKLAMAAIFSLSSVPLTIFRLLGLTSLVIAALLIGYALFQKLIAGVAVKAWTSTIVTVAFFGGLNLLGIGIIGQYIVRIYDEVRSRPRFIVDRLFEGGGSKGAEQDAGPDRAETGRINRSNS